MYPNMGCHAVLALLSEGYPPLRGRSPTRYSPVCHFTRGRSPFHVRLACVRHAASVDSEPGSNSQVKFAVSTPGLAASSRAQLVQPDQPVENGSRIHPTEAPQQPKPLRCQDGPFKYGWVCAPEGAAHPLILDGLCLHVLSSFQRTEPCIALPYFRSATFQIYDSSYIAVNPKNRPAARFFTPPHHQETTHPPPRIFPTSGPFRLWSTGDLLRGAGGDIDVPCRPAGLAQDFQEYNSVPALSNFAPF